MPRSREDSGTTARQPAQKKQDQNKHPHVSSGPHGGQFAKKGTAGGARRQQPTNSRTKPGTTPATKPHRSAGHLPPLGQGAANDPARVKQLQALVREMRLADIKVDGSYGPATAAAVKAIQAKLGMKQTGVASASLVRRLKDAHALSPCVGKPVAASAFDAFTDIEPDGRYVDTIPGGEAYDLMRWSDGTVWLTADGETGLVELDHGDARAVAAGLQALRDGDEDAVAVSDWLLLQAYDDGSVILAAGGDEPVAVDIPASDVDVLAGQLAGLSRVEAAAGHDTTPGHDELHHYWVDGEGAAKWVDSPTPWTTLVALLTKHVGPAKARIYASKWFVERFGFSAGSDKNRVAHGHPPRGHLVGPG